ncbi:hypothetical protein RRG08_007910 [Elysia crispata]|uniref:Uncharacterized protein n=1 Tax=Elysia crispata TaxID=231223 RepID=A0AAE0XW70_9GAST|nr:hypothetical protein RRG08_007910 [Elysia crispata]
MVSSSPITMRTLEERNGVHDSFQHGWYHSLALRFLDDGFFVVFVLSVYYMQRLISSMRRRILASIEAVGGPTRYQLDMIAWIPGTL